jgi:hypothetical protein
MNTLRSQLPFYNKLQRHGSEQTWNDRISHCETTSSKALWSHSQDLKKLTPIANSESIFDEMSCYCNINQATSDETN